MEGKMIIAHLRKIWLDLEDVKPLVIGHEADVKGVVTALEPYVLCRQWIRTDIKAGTALILYGKFPNVKAVIYDPNWEEGKDE